MATKLVIASGKRAGKAILLKRSEMLIGRAEECGIRLTSDEISRRHCSIKVVPDTVWVEDLRSRNGTFVNGRRISEKTKLYDGDLLRVGGISDWARSSMPVIGSTRTAILGLTSMNDINRDDNQREKK